jgi:hypothetical protein
MKIINLVVITSFVLSLLIAIGLDLVSSDYEFVPDLQIRLDENQTNGHQVNISKETVEKYFRTSGTLEPGNVEVQVVYLNPFQNVKGDHLIFQVIFNSNSVNLSNYDITKEAVIEDSNGTIITEGFNWKQLHRDSNHHFMGILIVPYLQPDQKYKNPSTKEDAEWIKLVIKGIPKVENREFRWDTMIS